MMGLLIMSVEKWFEDNFVKECLEVKVKKQNMEKFVFNLIYAFLSKNDVESKLLFRVYSKIISSHHERKLLTFAKIDSTTGNFQKAEVYSFFF